MEIFELRYFLAVAESENIHRASEKLHVSPGSLSKAITRIEDELSVKLFRRKGRNIELNEHGLLLQKRASTIVQLEESAKLELAGKPGNIRVIIAGSEILLSHMGVELSQKILNRFPKFSFEFHSVDDEEALSEVIKGEAHLALVTEDVQTHLNLKSKNLGEAQFHTYVGKSHPLYKAAVKKKISVKEVLKYSFASPTQPFLGKVGFKQSSDGWRDDQFPRVIQYLVSNLKLLEQLVVSGQAVAYLPDYFCKDLDLQKLSIPDCPYKCVQKIRLVARNPREISWLNQIF